MRREMLLSPIQLRHIAYTKILIDADAGAVSWSPNIDSSKIEYETDVEVNALEGRDPEKKEYMIQLSLRSIPSERNETPYLLDISAVAWIDLDAKFKTSNADDLVRINGASLIMSSIRELLLQLTSRCISGQFLLPTFRFPPPEKSGTSQDHTEPNTKARRKKASTPKGSE
jgi:hypothetical protein